MTKNEGVYTVIGLIQMPCQVVLWIHHLNQTFDKAKENLKDLGWTLMIYLSFYLYVDMIVVIQS